MIEHVLSDVLAAAFAFVDLTFVSGPVIHDSSFCVIHWVYSIVIANVLSCNMSCEELSK